MERLRGSGQDRWQVLPDFSRKQIISAMAEWLFIEPIQLLTIRNFSI